jgi:hypothetical protein
MLLFPSPGGGRAGVKELYHEHFTDITCKTSTVDYTLLLSRLEQEIIQGANLEHCQRILRQRQVWEKLEPNLQLKWAHLAQMSGDMEVTLAVYTHMNHNMPNMVSAWIEHIELLSILDRRTEAAKILAASRRYLTLEQYQQCLALCKGVNAEQKDSDISAASSPFEIMRTRQQGIERFMDLFSGREDCFARQWVEKSDQKQGYVPVKHGLEPKDVEDHLSGRMTYGIYLLKSDSRVKTAVIDVDLIQQYRQDQLSGKGFGNLVKLPQGIHRVSGKQSWFIDCRDKSVDTQLAFVSQIKPIPAGVLSATPETAPSDTVIMHPRFREWTQTYPELYNLEQCCPPLRYHSGPTCLTLHLCICCCI